MIAASPFFLAFLQVFAVIAYPCTVITFDTTDEKPQASQFFFCYSFLYTTSFDLIRWPTNRQNNRLRYI